jgi:hypothetical protein
LVFFFGDFPLFQHLAVFTEFIDRSRLLSQAFAPAIYKPDDERPGKKS